MQIAGARVLLTGATGGLGHAIARALAQRGGQLVLTGRRTAVLEPLAAELGARALAVDLADPSEVQRLLEEAGEVDILVANAALPASGTLDTYTVEQIDRALAVNVRAPVVLAHGLIGSMGARGGGHLLFMSSLSGKIASAGAALYNASKYALRGFAAALRADLRESRVGVSAVFPGFIRDAGMFADAGVELPPGVGTRSPVDVAPLPLRASAMLASVAPELAAGLARRLGADDISRRMETGQRDKR